MNQKRVLAGILSAVLLMPCASELLQTPLQAEAAVSYPVQFFTIGMSDTNNNVNASGTTLLPDKLNGTAAEKWSVNYVSQGVFEIVSAASGKILTANGAGVSLADDTDGAGQRWKIEGVQKDFDGYDLYYKITSNADSSRSLTFKDGVGFSLASYSGDGYQRFKLNLDGLEGWAANANTSAGEKACTIGGLLGEVVYVNTADDLEKQLNSVGAQTIVITGDIDMQTKGNTRIRDNKTIVGCYGSHTVYDCQLRTNDAYGAEDDSPSDNIILRNLKMVAKNTPNRILVNVWSSRQIWIDHIYFESQLSYDRTGNGQDEVGKFIWINTPYDSYLDAKDRLRSPDYVTISYCHLKNRYWTVAYGTQNDEITRDRTTLLYNWWDQNVRRCPQLGNGAAHVYNNYFSAYGKDSNGSATSGIIGGDGSDMISEHNYFNGYTLNQALMMGGGTDPARDTNSYLTEALNGTPSKVSFSPKNTSSWYPYQSNYGYSLLDAYNTGNTDTKAFCTKYAGDQTSASNMKYITDSEFAGWIRTGYASPFLRDVTLNVRTGAVMDTAFSYTFRNVNSGLYLSAADAAPSSGSNVQQGKPADKSAYTWKLADAGDGYYYIYTALNDALCIDLPYGSADNGTSIGLWANDESDARKFKFIDNGDGSYTICTKCSDDQSCFGVISDSTEDGADVIQWTSTGNNSQKWIVSPVLEPLSGSMIQTLDRLNPAYADAWSIERSLQDGAAVYGDRDVTYSGVPDVLIGAEYICTPCDAKNLSGDLAEFTAAEAMTVYIALDSRVETTPAWLADYSKTNLTVSNSNSVSYVLYAKDLAAGETVTLGENGQSSGCVHYTVIAVPQDTACDLNGDGSVNTADAVLLHKWLLCTPDTVLANWKAGDLDGNGRLNAADLTLLKRKLMAS